MADLIDRQAAIEAFTNNGSFFVYGADVCKAIVSRIKQIPAIEPERETGNICSVCKRTLLPSQYACGFPPSYCTYCGADMRGGQDE